MISQIIWWILVGLLVGALARLVVPGKQGISMPVTILIGIASAFLGGLLVYQLSDYKNNNGGVAWVPLIASIAIAGLAVGIYTRVQAARVGRSIDTTGLGGSGRAR